MRTALASLRAVDSRVLGCVLNMQPSKNDVDYYYRTYYRKDAVGVGVGLGVGGGAVAAPRSGEADPVSEGRAPTAPQSPGEQGRHSVSPRR